MSLKVFSINEVTIAAAGIPLVSGFADGEVIRIERPPAFVTKRGADGQVLRLPTNDKTARFRVRLMQSSEGNTVLSGLLALDLANPNGSGVFPFVVKDRLGTSKYTAARTWIEQPPEVSLGGEATVREWILATDDLDAFDGQN